MATNLTPNGVTLMKDGKDGVILQIVSLDKIEGGKPGPLRYRMMLSDGDNAIQCVLDQSMNDLVSSSQIENKCVVRVGRSKITPVSGKVIAIIFELEVVSGPVKGNIGNPKYVKQDAVPIKQNNNNSFNSSSSSNSSDSVFTPIKRIHPYNKWQIKASVMNKPEQMKEWHKGDKSGVLFSVDLMDREGGEIRATLFNDVARRFWDVLQVNKTYIISKATVKGANKKFGGGNSEYELNFNEGTICELVEDEGQMKIHYEFVPFPNIENLSKDTSVDILAIVKETGEVVSFTSKKGTDLKRRNVTLLDENSTTIQLTLWDDKADFPGWSESDHPVIAIKGCKVSEYNGKTLTLSRNARMEVEPDLDLANRLKQWYESQQGQEIKTKSLTTSFQPGGNSKYIKTNVEDINQPGLYEVKGYIATISDKKPFYPSCPTCKKTVEVDETTGQWKCRTCEVSTGCVYRYTLSFTVCDETSGKWMSIYGDLGRDILGREADELAVLSEAQLKSVLNNATYTQWRFFIKAANESYGEKENLRCRVNRMERICGSPPNFDGWSKETELLLASLSTLSM